MYRYTHLVSGLQFLSHITRVVCMLLPCIELEFKDSKIACICLHGIMPDSVNPEDDRTLLEGDSQSFSRWGRSDQCGLYHLILIVGFI